MNTGSIIKTQYNIIDQGSMQDYLEISNLKVVKIEKYNKF